MTVADPLSTHFDLAGIRRRTLHGASATAVAQLAKFCLQFGAQVVLARMLDPAQFGLVAMVAPVLGLVLALNSFGFGQAIVQRQQITQAQVSAMFWLNLAIGTGLMLLAMLAAPLIALMYGEPRTLWITVASASLILLSALTVVPQALLNRQMRFISLATTEVLAMVAGLASGIFSAWLGAGFWALVIMQATHSLVALLLTWVSCGWRPARPASAPGVGDLMRYGTHVMGSNVASHLSMSADMLIVGLVNGKVALGLYDRSFNLVVKPLGQLLAPASRIALPLLARLHDTPERYARVYLLMLQLTCAACLPGLLAIVICAHPLISLLLGPKWIDMVPVFFWIGLGGIASPLSASTYWLFGTQNRTGEQLKFGSMAAAISVCAFALGSVWGVVGVAMVAALSFLFLQTPLLVWAATRTGPVTRAQVVSGLWPIAVAGLVAAGATFGASAMTHDSRLSAIVTAFVVSYGSFAGMLMLLPAGRRMARNAHDMLQSRPRA